jgi:hypothetical protein
MFKMRDLKFQKKLNGKLRSRFAKKKKTSETAIVQCKNDVFYIVVKVGSKALKLFHFR